MQKIYGFTLMSCLLLLAVSTLAQDRLPRHIDRKFKKDATRLALRLEAQYEDFRYLNTEIPPENIRLIYNSLKNIYLKSDKAKSLANCNIHTFPDPPIERLVVIFEDGKIWSDASLASIEHSEYHSFNQLLSDFDLVIEKHFQWNGTQDAITVRARKPMNMAAVADQLNQFEGIESIDLGIPKTKGNNILLNRTSDGWEFEFILRFGNYLTGNGQSHHWKFLAGDDDSVKFLEESGDPLPDWMKCESLPNDDWATKI